MLGLISEKKFFFQKKDSVNPDTLRHSQPGSPKTLIAVDPGLGPQFHSGIKNRNLTLYVLCTPFVRPELRGLLLFIFIFLLANI